MIAGMSQQKCSGCGRAGETIDETTGEALERRWLQTCTLCDCVLCLDCMQRSCPEAEGAEPHCSEWYDPLADGPPVTNADEEPDDDSDDEADEDYDDD